MEKKRYFIVCFFGIVKSGYMVSNLEMITEDGSFVNEKEIKKLVRKNDPSIIDIAINNIMELNEKDFNDFT